jgi:hypothetical protein
VSIQYNPSNTLDILLHELFDYAGMFPPAARCFEGALVESASLPTTLRRPWLVGGDMVLEPSYARKLLKLDLREPGYKQSLRVCLLGTEEPASLIPLIEELQTSPRPDGVHLRVVSLEVRVTSSSVAETIQSYASVAQKHSILLALEPDLSTPSWESALTDVTASILSSGVRCALKCRGSGPTGIDGERLAQAVITTADARIPFKTTGGLHHPFVETERYNNTVGFLNLSAAVILRRIRGKELSLSTIIELLSNSDSSAISFGGGLAFKNIKATIAEVQKAKQMTSFSIGSCSLQEPDDDLVRLLEVVD